MEEKKRFPSNEGRRRREEKKTPKKMGPLKPLEMVPFHTGATNPVYP